MSAPQNVLAELVKKTIQTGTRTPLSQEERVRFHQEFEQQVAPVIENIRDQKKRSYEQVHDLAFW